MAKEPEQTPALRCGHCRNKSPQTIVATYSEVVTHEDEGFTWDSGPVWELLKCPSCNNVSLRTYTWHDHGDGDDPFGVTEMLYPSSGGGPKGLPERLRKAFDAMEGVRHIDANAFGVLARRLLELVCMDRKAKGDSLHKQLADLAGRGELPATLVSIAQNLKNFGNVGAHSSLGELSRAEVNVIEDLCRAVLDYVYTAPHLVQRAELAMKRLKNRNKAKNKE
jgi:hypothetical protein